MNLNENEALIRYLEFNLIKYIEEFEHRVVDPEIINDMYSRAYDILSDFDQSIKVNMIIDKLAQQNQNNKEG